ncbi:MAG: LytTR family DNA-binding domain-containing protein [Bacteroidales bacterium]|nr:LytTR family DNA-binding domain-containing protein [Bacteroidales bacterium]
MKVLIIEDEQLAYERMVELIKEVDKNISICGNLDSVKKSIEWFQENELPDLVFMDIQLADGLSFEIFDHVTVDCPIIFTTAYQEYAIKAFKVNSIDYLLKPIDSEELNAAFKKFKKRMEEKENTSNIPLEVLNDVKKMLDRQYKNRFVVKVGEHIKSIEVKDILFFYSLDKGTYMHTKDKRSLNIDFSLDTIQELVDPMKFFRVNRKFLVSHPAIEDIVVYSNSRLKLKLTYSTEEDVLVSREKVQAFKSWLDE